MKKIIRRLAAAAVSAAVSAAVALAAPSFVLAAAGAADAAGAYTEGQAAFAAGKFELARELFTKSSQTDPKNAEVFLWLGRADLQLGKLDEAVAAFTTTLQLAPAEPTAARMLAALRGERGDAAASIKIAEALLREGFNEPALAAIGKVLADASTTEAQRAGALLLKAGALLELNRAADAEAVVTELTIQYAKVADADTLALLAGRARLASAEQQAQGAAMLQKLAADRPNTEAGVSAQVELLKFQLLADGPTAAKADALARWIGAHPDHRAAHRARALLVQVDLQISVLTGGANQKNAPLHPYDRAAIGTAAEMIKRSGGAASGFQLTQRIVEHLQVHYGAHQAYAAAIEGGQLLLKAPLPPSARRIALNALAGFQTERAMAELTALAEAEKISSGPGAVPVPMPASLAEALSTLDAISREFPAEPAWRQRGALAARLRGIAAANPWPPTVTELKPALAWAVAVALPVVENSADRSAVDAAVAVVLGVIGDTVSISQPGAQRSALNASAALIAVLSRTNPHWTEAMFQQVDLLDTVAKLEFQENRRAGKLSDNAQLSDTQKKFLTTLGTIVNTDAKQTPAAIQKLDYLLAPWLAAEYDAVGEAAYAQLAAAAPEGERRQVRLAAVGIWLRHAAREEQRLAAAGIAEPRKLDPSLAKALQSLYELQAGVDDRDPFLQHVRGMIDRIVGHYKAIKYEDVARAAILEKPPAVNPQAANTQAAAYAQWQLAVLADESARREITALLKQYKSTDKLSLTDGTKAAISAYETFIADHPVDPLAMRAAEAVFATAARFEQYAAYDVAAQIDRDFAAFAGKIPVLAAAPGGQSSVAEKAAFAAVTVSDVKARGAMAKSTAKSAQENKGVAAPPAKISEEFAAAIGAYKAFVKSSPQSPFVSQAVLRINAIALDYARADAWDVADAIYAGLAADALSTREPERIAFSRGMCQIGKVMPEHAKEVLATLLGSRAVGGAGEFGNDAFKDLDDGLKKLTEDTKARERRMQDFDAQGTADVPAPVTRPAVAFTPPPLTEAPYGIPKAQPSAAVGGRGRGGGGTEERDMGGFRGAGDRVAAADDRAKADAGAMAAITQQESRRAQQVAMLRDSATRNQRVAGQKLNKAPNADPNAPAEPGVPVLSEEELQRQQAALDAAYAIFQEIHTKHLDTPTAEQAHGEIMVEISYWRGIAEWQRAAAMGERFLTDNPTDPKLPQLRLGIATDHLAWAAKPLAQRPTSQEMLAEVSRRFNAARAELAKVTTDFPEERVLIEDAQWRIATSFLTQARAVDAFSATLARGQFTRAAKELRRVAGEYAQHPQIGNIPQMLWEISMELHNRNYHEEALSVWNMIAIDYPTHPLAQQAMVMTAQTFQSVLGRPLRAAEVYLEINHAHGGNDAAMQNSVFAIGADLKNQKRWIEALRVLENFVQAFPQNPQAGQALAMIGQIHQANDAWSDAIAAYKRVINEFPAAGQWVQDAKWSIAECTINLSQWKEAVAAYESYVASFPKDAKVAEANRRIGVLKDLANYQKLVDEDGLKAYDAQFQIAVIVNAQLSNWRKAVGEYQKVAKNWPKSHLAADALHSLGLLHLKNGEVDEARAALRAVATNYPDSPYASDSLFQVGKSYEDEANALGTVTRAVTLERNKELAQKKAYAFSNSTLSFSRNAQNDKVIELRLKGKKDAAELQAAQNSGNFAQLNDATINIAAENANREQEDLTAGQLADRQDKINAALRKAVAVYADAAKVPGGDKAGEALLHQAVIQNDRLGDSAQAMATWLEIVRQFSGTAVAEEASWQIAQHYEKAGQYDQAVTAYKDFLRNYRRSPKAADAQFFIAENYEHLGQWISAMDQYTNYVQNFPEGVLVQKAREQISFIKTYRL